MTIFHPGFAFRGGEFKIPITPDKVNPEESSIRNSIDADDEANVTYDIERSSDKYENAEFQKLY